MGKGNTGVPSDFQKYGNLGKGNPTLKVGDKVSWTATKDNKGIKKGQKVSSTIQGVEGDQFKDMKGNIATVPQGYALFKTAGQGLPFQKPLKDLEPTQ